MGGEGGGGLPSGNDFKWGEFSKHSEWWKYPKKSRYESWRILHIVSSINFGSHRDPIQVWFSVHFSLFFMWRKYHLDYFILNCFYAPVNFAIGELIHLYLAPTSHPLYLLSASNFHFYSDLISRLWKMIGFYI